jgi:short subunit dehydrogenase-like uncharacterized protein
MTSIWLFGATGRGGRTVAQALTARGIPVVLLGRNPQQLASVAGSLSGGPDTVETLAIAGLSEVPSLIERHRPGVIVNTVGPFTQTGIPLALACLKAGTHYVDLANELDAVLRLLDLNAEAHDRGITIVTGAGFGVLATEALAITLRGEREPALKAEVAALPAVEALGSAVLASSVDVLAYGGRRYHDGQLVRNRFGADHIRVSLPSGSSREAVGVPTGELEAARRASGAGEVVAYSSEVPSGRIARALLPIMSVVLSVTAIRRQVLRLIEHLRLAPPVSRGEVSWAYARLEWADHSNAEAWLRTGEGYAFTGEVAALVADGLREGSLSAGAFTPGALFGPTLAVRAGAEVLVPGNKKAMS